MDLIIFTSGPKILISNRPGLQSMFLITLSIVKLTVSNISRYQSLFYDFSSKSALEDTHAMHKLFLFIYVYLTSRTKRSRGYERDLSNSNDLEQLKIYGLSYWYCCHDEQNNSHVTIVHGAISKKLLYSLLSFDRMRADNYQRNEWVGYNSI